MWDGVLSDFADEMATVRHSCGDCVVEKRCVKLGQPSFRIVDSLV